MADDGHIQKGKQTHAQGMHGDKTRKAIIDSQISMSDDSTTEGVAERGSPYGANPSDGRHRLSEEREQHDEAEKGSELRKTNGSDKAR